MRFDSVRSLVGLLRRSDSKRAEALAFKPIFEHLESRQFLSASAATIAEPVMTSTLAPITTLATVNVDGTYNGNATLNGGTKKVALSVSISGKGTKVKFTIAVRSGFTIKPSIKTVFTDKSGTMTARFTTPIGGGTIKIKSGKLTLAGSFDPIFADPFTLAITANKAATTSAKVITSALTKEPTMSTMAVNPLIGTFSGKFTISGPINATFPYKAVITQKAGSSRLPMVATITIPNFGDLQLSFAVTPNSAGKFSVNIGSTSDQGTVSGRFTSAGKFVLTFSIPGAPTISGTGSRV